MVGRRSYKTLVAAIQVKIFAFEGFAKRSLLSVPSNHLFQPNVSDQTKAGAAIKLLRLRKIQFAKTQKSCPSRLTFRLQNWTKTRGGLYNKIYAAVFTLSYRAK